MKFVYMGRNVCHLGQTKICNMECYEKQIFLFWFIPLMRSLWRINEAHELEDYFTPFFFFFQGVILLKCSPTAVEFHVPRSKYIAWLFSKSCYSMFTEDPRIRKPNNLIQQSIHTQLHLFSCLLLWGSTVLLRYLLWRFYLSNFIQTNQ